MSPPTRLLTRARRQRRQEGEVNRARGVLLITSESLSCLLCCRPLPGSLELGSQPRKTSPRPTWWRPRLKRHPLLRRARRCSAPQLQRHRQQQCISHHRGYVSPRVLRTQQNHVSICGVHVVALAPLSSDEEAKWRRERRRHWLPAACTRSTRWRGHSCLRLHEEGGANRRHRELNSHRPGSSLGLQAQSSAGGGLRQVPGRAGPEGAELSSAELQRRGGSPALRGGKGGGRRAGTRRVKHEEKGLRSDDVGRHICCAL